MVKVNVTNGNDTRYLATSISRKPIQLNKVIHTNEYNAERRSDYCANVNIDKEDHPSLANFCPYTPRSSFQQSVAHPRYPSDQTTLNDQDIKTPRDPAPPSFPWVPSLPSLPSFASVTSLESLEPLDLRCVSHNTALSNTSQNESPRLTYAQTSGLNTTRMLYSGHNHNDRLFSTSFAQRLYVPQNNLDGIHKDYPIVGIHTQPLQRPASTSSQFSLQEEIKTSNTTLHFYIGDTPTPQRPTPAPSHPSPEEKGAASPTTLHFYVGNPSIDRTLPLDDESSACSPTPSPETARSTYPDDLTHNTESFSENFKHTHYSTHWTKNTHPSPPYVQFPMRVPRAPTDTGAPDHPVTPPINRNPHAQTDSQISYTSSYTPPHTRGIRETYQVPLSEGKPRRTVQFQLGDDASDKAPGEFNEYLRSHFFLSSGQRNNRFGYASTWPYSTGDIKAIAQNLITESPEANAPQRGSQLDLSNACSVGSYDNHALLAGLNADLNAENNQNLPRQIYRTKIEDAFLNWVEADEREFADLNKVIEEWINRLPIHDTTTQKLIEAHREIDNFISTATTACNEKLEKVAKSKYGSHLLQHSANNDQVKKLDALFDKTTNCLETLAVHLDDPLYIDLRAEAQYALTAWNSAAQLKRTFQSLSRLAQQANPNIPFTEHEVLSANIENFMNVMHLFEIVFETKEKVYLAKASVAHLQAHAIYEQQHGYRILQKSTLPGTHVAHTKELAISCGTGIPVSNSQIKCGVNLELSAADSKSISLAPDSVVSYAKMVSGKTKIAARLSFFKNLFHAGVYASIAGTQKGDYFETDQGTQGVRNAIIYKAVIENDRRFIKLHPQNGMRKKVKTISNRLGKIVGFSPKDPSLPTYATSKVLEQANGAFAILSDIYQQLGIIRSPKCSTDYKISDTLVLSIASVISSPGTARRTRYPWTVIEGSTGATLGISADKALEHLPEHVSRRYIPRLDVHGRAAASQRKVGLAIALLQPPHILLSMAYTRDYKASMAAAEEVIDTVWHASTTNHRYPEHLRQTISLFKTPINWSHTEQVLTRVRKATDVINQLMASYDTFEKIAAQFIACAKRDLTDPFHRDRYLSLRKKIHHYQFKNDATLNKEPKKKYRATKKACAKIWDSYSTSLAIAELAGLGQVLNKERTLDAHPSLRFAVKIFCEIYNAFSARLAEPDFQFTQDALYRYGAVQSKTNVIRTHTTIEGHLGTSISAPALTIPGLHRNDDHSVGIHPAQRTRLGVGVSGQKTSTSVEAHPNPFRTGKFTTCTKAVSGTAPFVDLLIKSEEIIKNNKDRGWATVRMIVNTLGISEMSGQYTSKILRRNGKIQLITTSKSNTGSLDITTPNLLTPTGVGDLDLSCRRSETRTSVATFMGPELGIHVLQFPMLAQYGISIDTLDQIKQESQIDLPENANIKILLKDFFTKINADIAVCGHYFGINAIAELLEEFSLMSTESPTPLVRKKNGNYEFDGFDVFTKKITQIYFEKRNNAANTCQNILSATIKENPDIFSEIGVSRHQVAKWLAQTYQDPKNEGYQRQTSIKQFLAQTTPSTRAHFFASHPTGNALFAAYLLIVNMANDIKCAFNVYELSIEEHRKISPPSTPTQTHSNPTSPINRAMTWQKTLASGPAAFPPLGGLGQKAGWTL